MQTTGLDISDKDTGAIASPVRAGEGVDIRYHPACRHSSIQSLFSNRSSTDVKTSPRGQSSPGIVLRTWGSSQDMRGFSELRGVLRI
jgi:hypothetical protein